MNDEECPICKKNKLNAARSDEVCELCNMPLVNYAVAPTHTMDDGKIQYFCCGRCLDIYVNEILKNAELIRCIQDQCREDVLESYDDGIQKIILDYLNRKYPLPEIEGKGG